MKLSKLQMPKLKLKPYLKALALKHWEYGNQKKVFYQLLHLSFRLVVSSKQMILIILLITITL